MRSRKRISAPRRKSGTSARTPPVNDEPFTPYLAALTEGCFINDIDPSACVPLNLVRSIIKNAVKKLKTLLSGRSRFSSSALPGYFSGSPCSMVIPLEGELQILLHDFFASQYETEEEVQAAMRVHEKWYGIVDGCQIHAAIMELRDECPSQWADFSWKVTVLRHTASVSDLRKLARAQNERNKREYTYDVTIYDLLSGLRKEHDLLVKEKKRESRTGTKGVTITSREIAERYDGSEHPTNTSLRQAAGVALKLSTRTIEALGEVVNTACADVIVQSEDLNSLSLETEEEVLGHLDCRLFKSFVCFGAIRSATNFLHALKHGFEEEQVNTIYRIRNYCEKNTYKPVQADIISEQFDLAIQARREERTFLRTIRAEQWPQHMDTARENLLRTTQCDAEIKGNRGNDTDVITSLWKCFESLYPAKAATIKAGRKAQAPEDNESSSSDPPPPPDSAAPSEDENEEEEEELTPEQKEEERVNELQSTADKKLEEAAIKTFHMPLSQFSAMTWTSTSTKADLVFSCLTEAKDDKLIEMIPDFCKLVCNNGS